MPKLRHSQAERLRIRQWLQQNDQRLALLPDPRPIAVAQLLWKETGLRIDPTQLGKLAWFYLDLEWEPPVLVHWRPNLRPLPAWTNFHGDLLVRVQRQIRQINGARAMEPGLLARMIERRGPAVSVDAAVEARRLMRWPKE